MSAAGSPLRVPHRGWGASAEVNQAPIRMERGLCMHGEAGGGGARWAPARRWLRSGSVGCPGWGHVPFGEDACVGVCLGESCSSRAFPPRSPHALRSRRGWQAVGAGRAAMGAVVAGASSPGAHGCRRPAARLCVPERPCQALELTHTRTQTHTALHLSPTRSPGS